MRKIYYVYDQVERQRLRIASYLPNGAAKLCTRLKKEHPGRYQCGDWVSEKEWRGGDGLGNS